MTEYKEVKLNGDIPQSLKLIMVFIDRVGFPVLAFCLMFYMSFISLQKATASINENTKALLELKSGNTEFQRFVCDDHKRMDSKLDRIGERYLK